jgi:hypothetical protein
MKMTSARGVRAEPVTDTPRKERTPPMQRETASIRRHVRIAVLIVLAFVTAGCGASTTTEDVALNGRRVQGARLVGQGAVPYEVGAYELVFADQPGAAGHTRRAALLVDLFGGQGSVVGFAEWGRSGEIPKTYVVGGWARQRNVEGEVVTVFELALNHVEPRDAPRSRRDPRDATPVAVRILVNETSGDVTLISRR